MNQNTNFSIVERAQGHGPAIGQDELLDLLAELDAWRGTFAGARNTRQIECVDTPEELVAYIEELESNQENPDHADYDDLKEFFDDCADIIGYCSPWQSTADNVKAMLEELHEMNRQLGG